MDSEKCKRYQTAMVSTYPDTNFLDYLVMPDGTERSNGSDLLTMLLSGKVFMINSRRRNGLILFKRFHAEFAGPGAAVGGDYDRDCLGALPIGNLSLLTPDSHEERQKAYLIRRQWIRLIRQITENVVPQQRVQKILDQFEQYFPPEMVAALPDEAFALLVGVLPQTVRRLRHFGSDTEGRYD
jgi:hypothetical protein